MSVLKGMYAAEAEYLAAGGPGDASFAPLAPFFASDVVLHQAEALPYGGVWRGHEGMERFFLAMSRAWDTFDMVEQTFLTDTSPLVILTHVHARANATGRELDFPILQTITVENGRITEVHPFYWDTAAIAKACSPH
jgi:ketosteroid isomerase-like protein